ncbi:MAG: polyribonucleotide nucleotidyltransferase [Saprospiraceae bacterium]|nr:polyribonucleotide nucleotidyltransferase [Bacteroidia bacterium]NNE15261.1 polyribonucleotide nucleotidyltransferase [Saprospiraceae bacterium]NNL93117.1 polyribonucleotide nucleotidyltransferase [Saprospiraceae bacterium]
MGLQTPTTTSFDLPNGETVTLETGKLATQAHGSCVVKIGKTMLFCSVVSAKKAREGQPFFPLSVDYQEKFASVGRIPGNFFKREARLSDYEILTSRLVDRAIRPLFPDGYMNDTQVIINLISGELDRLPDAYTALAASTALSVSNIPWAGPISEVRVAKIDGEYVINPAKSQLENASLEIIVAATLENVMMVEGEAKECQEEELIDAIKAGHEAIKVQCQAQLDLAKLVGDKALVKREIEVEEINEELYNYVKAYSVDPILTVARGALNKEQRKEQFSEVAQGLEDKLKEEKGEEYFEEFGELAAKYLGKIQKATIRQMVLDEDTRLDGRKFDQVRPIWTEVDYLPSAHGSAIFNRGETQALTSLTLGTKLDKQMIDTALENYYSKFILHYNFPALSVGEIKPMRGPGRREVGHANLASRALQQVLPDDVPYTIRLVSDILESNGSSSMATVCAGSLALMDGGIPIKSPVSGIAMGMIAEGDKIAILSDILGDEDALGDMDFKVTGTENGITACQMDIKIDGLPYSTMEKALIQAKDGRIHILNEMAKSLSTPNEDLKPHAPRIEEIVIDKSFIGAVIGPGGKVIQDIQARSGAVINIEEVDDKGVVSISSNDADSLKMAKDAVLEIAFEPSVGDVFDAVVASVQTYGVFVDFKGKSGLLHVSEISHSRINDVSEVFKVGDPVKVKLIGIDPKSGKYKLSRRVLLPNPRDNKPQES